MGLCLHPDIRLEQMDWDDEQRLPAWARDWEKNILVIKAEEVSPIIHTARPKIDLVAAAADMM